MPLIDSHIHLTSPKYTDLPGLVLRSQQAGIAGVVAAAVDEASSQRTLDFIQRFPSFVHGGLGVHPERTVSDAEMARVIALIRHNRSRLAAIAEVGLPWYTVREHPDRDALIAAAEPRLQCFLELARELDLAVVLHAPHDTAARALALLRTVGVERAVFHWHKATAEVTQAIIAAGYYISVTPETCYRSRDRELVAAVPLTHLVIETDGPWPYGGAFAGQPTEPTFLPHVVKAIASIKAMHCEEVRDRVTVNAQRLFDLS